MVQGLRLTPQIDGSVGVSWNTPVGVLGREIYSVQYSSDLEHWTEIYNAEIELGESVAHWLDDGSLTGVKGYPAPKIFYRVFEKSAIALSKISNLSDENEPIPLSVIYSGILEPFEADEEILERYRERRDLSFKQNLSHVLGHYIIRLEEDVYAYEIDRAPFNTPMLVTREGVAHQCLVAELVEKNGGELTHVFTSSAGFAAYLPPAGVEALRNDERVKYLSADLIIRLGLDADSE